jgi:hypothetical protein
MEVCIPSIHNSINQSNHSFDQLSIRPSIHQPINPSIDPLINQSGKTHIHRLGKRYGGSDYPANPTIEYFCDLCEISLGFERHAYDTHLDGKDHRKKLDTGRLFSQMRIFV